MECTEENKVKMLESSTGDLRFGWGRFQPKCLQIFNNAKFFLLFLVIFSVIQGMTVTGITVMNLQVLEKRFQLTSKDIGFIAASNDISAILLTCFVSFYGAYACKPKWLGLGSFLTGLGSLLFALPHLLIGRYEPEVSSVGSDSADICNLNSTAQGGATTCFSGYSARWYYLFTFSVAQMIMGAGTTPLYALGPAYLDENVSPKSSPVYLGLFFASALIGPGLGFVVGGSILEIWIDIEMPEGLDITSDHPRWVGAWWLGYVVGGLFLTLNSVFLLGFPRELPGAREMREKAISDGDLPKPEEKIKGKVKDIIPATVMLLKNPTYICNTFAMTVGSLFGAGIATFIAKFSQMKFAVNPQQLGAALGIVLIIGGGGGIIIGGCIVRRFNLKKSCKKSALYCVIFTLFSAPGVFAWLIPGCEEIQLAGISAPYLNSSRRSLFNNPSLVTSCNTRCGCSEAAINPVCGDDNLVYFSPCHAGCKNKASEMSFAICSCILPLGDNTTSNAKRGFCERSSGCKNFYPYLGLTVCLLLVTFLTAIPNKTVALRSVPDNQRAYALGVQFIFQRSIGFLPGPLLFGAVFDSLCTLWGKSCGRRGSCQLYDIGKLSLWIAIMGAIIRGVTILFYCISYYYCKPSFEDSVDKGANKETEGLMQEVAERETVI